VEEREIDIIKTQSYIAVFFITIIYIYIRILFPIFLSLLHVNEHRSDDNNNTYTREEGGGEEVYISYIVIFFTVL